MYYILGVPGIWGPVPWSKAGPDQLLKSYKKRRSIWWSYIFSYFFQMERSYVGPAVVVGIVIVKALTGI
jgi:hypothetical protein